AMGFGEDGRQRTGDGRAQRCAYPSVLCRASSVLYFLRKRSSRTTSAPPVGLSGSSSDGVSVGSADLAAAETAGAVRGCLGSATGRAVAISPCFAAIAAACGAGTCLGSLGTSATSSNLTPNCTEGSTKPLIAANGTPIRSGMPPNDMPTSKPSALTTRSQN